MNWHPAPDQDAASARSLREAINRLLVRGGHGEVALLSKVLEVWESTVGSHVASHVRPTAIDGETLHVDVDQPAWATEVVFLADQILSGLQLRLGQHIATFVKARVRGRSDVE